MKQNTLNMDEIIKNIWHTFLESNIGFGLMGTKYQIRINGKYYYPSIVFYHLELRCIVIVNVKRQKINEKDIARMKLFMNYFLRYDTASCGIPPIGLIITPKETKILTYKSVNEIHIEDEALTELDKVIQRKLLPLKNSTKLL